MKIGSWMVIVATAVLSVTTLGCGLFGPKHSSNGDLTLEDVACVKTWLKISFGATGGDYELKRDGSVVLTGSYAGDTVVVDTTVEPSRSYTYEAELISDGKVIQTSSPVEVTTLDTTSSDYTFRTWEIGGIVPGSYLNDVTIINDTDICAVGEINIKDSSGACGAIHWNGRTWTLKRVPYFYQGQVFYDQMLSVFALSADDIFVGGNGYYRWNGIRIEQEDTANGVSHGELINGIWAGDDNEVYIVESQGGIGYFTGATWRSLSSGTSTSIDDIWGKVDAETGKQVILAAVSNGILVQGGERGIIEIHKDGMVTKIPWSPDRDVLSVWFSSLQNIYTAGDGIYNGNGTSWRLALPLAGQDYTARVRGNGANDILVVGDYGYCVHFNGVSWQTYPQISLPNGGYSGLSVKGKTMCAVGYSNNYAVIALSTRD